ncbi:MAG: hypothetical protein RLY93_12340 [Sumerlaeia bacterium]
MPDDALLVRLYFGGARTAAADVMDLVTSFDYEEAEEGDDQAQVVIVDPTGALLDDPRLTEGTALEVQWGYAGNLSPPRSVVLEEPEFEFSGGVVTITLVAHGGTDATHGTGSQRVWQGMTHSQVAEAIARGYGFRPDVDPLPTLVDSEPQGGLSDYDFLAHLAGQNNYELFVEDGRLRFGRRRNDEAPVLAISYLHDRESRLLTFRPKSNRKEKRAPIARVDAVGFDPMEGEAIRETASDESSDEPRLSPYRYELNANTGEVIRVEAEGDAPTSAAAKSEGAGEARLIQSSPHQTTAEVKALAENTQKAALVSSVEAELAIVGLPSLRSRRNVRLEGFSPKWDGVWRVAAARHSLGGRGYTTSCHLRRDGVGADQPGAEESSRPANHQPAAAGDGEEIEVVDAEGVRIDANTGRVL